MEIKANACGTTRGEVQDDLSLGGKQWQVALFKIKNVNLLGVDLFVEDVILRVDFSLFGRERWWSCLELEEVQASTVLPKEYFYPKLKLKFIKPHFPSCLFDLERGGKSSVYSLHLCGAIDYLMVGLNSFTQNSPSRCVSRCVCLLLFFFISCRQFWKIPESLKG